MKATSDLMREWSYKDVSAGVLCATKLASFTNWTDSENATGVFSVSE